MKILDEPASGGESSDDVSDGDGADEGDGGVLLNEVDGLIVGVVEALAEFGDPVFELVVLLFEASSEVTVWR
jgi:hypothetical protein